MLKLDSSFLTYWNLLICIVAGYDIFHIPYIIGFAPYYSFDYEIEVNDYIIMIIYLFDIFIKFRTIYFDDQTGKKTFIPSEVAKLRMKDYKTYFDIIAFIPFSKILWEVLTYDQRNFITMIRMVKFYRGSFILEII